jgi:Na+/H+ antiporter NhaD/arsenite permease-like protein
MAADRMCGARGPRTPGGRLHHIDSVGRFPEPARCLGGERVPSQHFVPHVFFDLDPMMVSAVVLCVTYGVIIWDKLNRAIVALLGAAFMIIIGVLDQNEALKGVDWNTIGLLTGMMILVSISRPLRMFEYLAIWSAQKAKASPAGILLLLQITTAVVSALLDNVTTVLLVVPVTLAITKELDVPPTRSCSPRYFASNIGARRP